MPNVRNRMQSDPTRGSDRPEASQPQGLAYPCYVLENERGEPESHQQTGGSEVALSLFTARRLAAPLLEVEQKQHWHLRGLPTPGDLEVYLRHVSPDFTHVLVDAGPAGTSWSMPLADFIAAVAKQAASNAVDEASQESFPASDPPSWTPVTRP